MLEIYVALSDALKTLTDDIDGASLVEYGLVVALVAVVVIFALVRIENDIGNAFNVIRTVFMSGVSPT